MAVVVRDSISRKVVYKGFVLVASGFLKTTWKSTYFLLLESAIFYAPDEKSPPTGHYPMPNITGLVNAGKSSDGLILMNLTFNDGTKVHLKADPKHSEKWIKAVTAVKSGLWRKILERRKEKEEARGRKKTDKAKTLDKKEKVRDLRSAVRKSVVVETPVATPQRAEVSFVQSSSLEDTLDGEDWGDEEVGAAWIAAEEEPERVQVMGPFEPQGQGQLKLAAGDIVRVLSKDPSGWWEGEIGNRIGWFPSSFVKPVPATSAITQAAAYVASNQQRQAMMQQEVMRQQQEMQRQVAIRQQEMQRQQQQQEMQRQQQQQQEMQRQQQQQQEMQRQWLMSSSQPSLGAAGWQPPPGSMQLPQTTMQTQPDTSQYTSQYSTWTGSQGGGQIPQLHISAGRGRGM